MEIEEIGVVKNEFDQPESPEEMRREESTIQVYSRYGEGLHRIDENRYLQVLFYLHLSEGYELVAPRRHGTERGVFASRSPHRPNPIGSTVVELLERDGNDLRIRGLDAVNGTPILDIKPYAEPFDRSPSSTEEKRSKPRKEIEELIARGDREGLLLKSGELHGHFCPYLALGVVAGQYAVNELGGFVPDMEDAIAVIETNSCFSDGIQYVTGCSFGNNSLVYRDFGKTAVTVAYRNGPGIRLYLRETDFLERDYPEGKELFNRVVKDREGTEEDERRLKNLWRDIGFEIVGRSARDMFEIEEIVSPEIPDYAPIFEDGYCENCGEKYMAPKGVEVEGKKLCKSCSGGNYLQLDGSGLREVKGKRN